MKKLLSFLLIISLFADDSHFQNDLFIYYKPEEISGFALPHSILEKHELEKNPGKTIAQTLENLPGISQSFFTGAVSRPIIRGASGDRIRILENSLGVADVSNASDDHQVMSDPIEADEFSVLRGPATLFYGSNASGGIVQLKDKSIARSPVEREFAGQLDLRAGSVDNEQTGALKLFGQQGNHNWYVSGYSRDTDSYDSPLGVQENTQSLSQGLTFGDSYIWNTGFLGISVSHRKARYGIPGGAHAHEDEEEHHEDEHDHEEEHEEEAGIFLDPKMNKVDLIYHQDKPFRYFDSIETSLRSSWYDHNENEDGAVATTYRNNSQELRVDLSQNKTEDLSGGIGANFRNSDFVAKGEEAFIPSSNTNATSIYSFEEFNFKPTLLQFGLNHEYQNVSPDGFKNADFNLSSASIGVIYPFLKSYSVNFTTTYSERAPSVSELYSNGLHLARSSYEIGDQNLGEERSFNHEVGIAKNLGRLKSQFNVYYRDYNDFIAIKPTGEKNEGFDVYQYSAIEARFYGFEFSNKINVINSNLGNLDFSLSNDLVRAIDEDSNKEIPKTPPVKTVLALDYDKNRYHIGVREVITSSQDKLAENETKTNGFHTLNASFSYDLDPSEKISVFVDGNNLTNEEIRLHTSFTRDLLVLPGRNVLFGVKARF